MVLPYETVRQWCRKCGQGYAKTRRQRRPQPGDKGHLDEVCSGSNGVRHDLWRVVDQAGNVRDSLVPARRRLRKQVEYVPRALVTDTLARYGAARRKVLPRVAHQAPPAAQQPGGERAPADPRAGAADAAVHVARPRPALPRRLRPQRWPLPPQTPPPHRRRLPRDPRRALRHLAGGHRCPSQGLSGERPVPHHAPQR